VQQECITTAITAAGPFAAIGERLDATMSPVMQFVLGTVADSSAWVQSHPWPTMWINGAVPQCRPTAQAIVISGADVRDIALDGRIVGRAYADEHADYCWLGGVLPEDARQSRPQQARSCFLRMESALRCAGMGFEHVVRTWLFLDRLLDWYADFNAVRTAFFEQRGLFGRMLPASTGIGAANPAGAALMAGALAIRPRTAAMRIQAVPSPLQCPATAYRSSFSRAVEVACPGLRQLYISGTASITPDGATAHRGDAARQVQLTMNVVHAILRSRDMDWNHVTRMIAYFRDIADLSHFNTWCRRQELGPLPAAFAQAVVCRDDLLFEVELDAASSAEAEP